MSRTAPTASNSNGPPTDTRRRCNVFSSPPSIPQAAGIAGPPGILLQKKTAPAVFFSFVNPLLFHALAVRHTRTATDLASTEHKPPKGFPFMNVKKYAGYSRGRQPENEFPLSPQEITPALCTTRICALDTCKGIGAMSARIANPIWSTASGKTFANQAHWPPSSPRALRGSRRSPGSDVQSLCAHSETRHALN